MGTFRSTLHESGARAVIGTAICTVLAGLITALVNQRNFSWVPLAFLLIILLIAHFFGSTAGILGCLSAAVIFAAGLYPPLGSVWVQSADARSNLGWMVLTGTSVSFLLARNKPEPHQ